MPTNTPVSAKPSINSSLQSTFNDPKVNMDAKFLDNLQKVFEDNETSLMFKPHLNKVKSVFCEARHNMKNNKKYSLKLTLINKEITQLMETKTKRQAL